MANPAERDIPWLWSRRFWLVSGGLLLAFATWLALSLAGPLSGKPGVVAVVGLDGSPGVVSGGPSRYRVHARDIVTGAPLADEPVLLEVQSWGKNQYDRVASAEGRTDESGQWLGELTVPELPAGSELRVFATLPRHREAGVANLSAYRRAPASTFLASDKPWYQPGQTIHLRALTLADDGPPVSDSDVTFEVKNAEGTKIFRETKKSSRHGIAAVDFALADEVTLGTYAIEARGPRAFGQLSVEVKRYALPKGKVSIELEPTSDADEKQLSGKVVAAWSFGKPIDGAEVTLHFGTAESAPVFSGKTSAKGELAFAVKRSTSTLFAKVTVEGGTLLEAKREVPGAWTTPQLEVFSESGEPVPGVENEVYIVTTDAAGQPFSTKVGIEPSGGVVQTNERGIGLARLMMVENAPPWVFNLETQRKSVQTSLSVAGGDETPALLIRTARSTLPAGQSIPVRVLASPLLDGDVVLGLWKGSDVLATAHGTLVNGVAEIPLALPARVAGLVRIEATRFTTSGIKVGRRMFLVEGTELALGANVDKPRHAPGEKAVVDLSVRGPGGVPTRAALGLSAVDEAFFALADVRPDLEKRFFSLDRSLAEITRAELRPAVVARQEGYRIEPRASHVAPRTPGVLDGDPALDDVRNVALAVVSARYSGARRRDMDWERGRIPWAAKRRAEILGGVGSIASLALAALALLGFIVYGVARIREPAYVGVGVKDHERWLGVTRRLLVAMILGLGVPWLAALVAGATGDSLRLPRYRLDYLLAAGWLFGALVAAAWQGHEVQRAGETQTGQASPALRRALWLVPTAFFFAQLSVAASVAGSGKWERRLLSEGGRHVAIVLAVLMLYQLAIGAVSVVRQSAAFTTTRRRRIWLFASRPLFVGLPLTLIGLGLLTYKEVTRESDYYADYDDYYDDWYEREEVASRGDNREGGTGTRAKGEEGSMGNPNRRYAVQGPSDNPGLVRPTRVRSYFPETLLWMPEVVTDLSGNARVEIPLADSITQYRLSVSAVSDQGLLGSLTFPLEVFQDFFVDVTAPATLTQGDALSVPVTVFNYLDGPQTVRLELEAPGFDAKGKAVQELVLAARETRGIAFDVSAKHAGEQVLRVKASGTKLADAVERKVLVNPNGMPLEELQSGLVAGPTRLIVTTPPNAIEGGSQLTLKVYGGVLSQLAESLDGVLRQPHGCFEQTSSSTYPNVLVLDFLKRSGTGSPAVEQKARTYIDEGYQRLLTFEIPGGGFDWYGRGPANVLLSAYGLLEFSDMAKVRLVDEELLARTRAFLYSKQLNDGTWESPSHGVGSALTSSSNELATAYVAWAMAAAGERDPRLDRALSFVEGRVEKAEAYELAIAGNALAAAGRKPAAQAAAARLVKLAKRERGQARWPSGRGEDTYFYGDALEVELTALAAHLLSVLELEPELRHEARAYLFAKRESTGAWSTTSSTIAALRALLDDVPRLDTAEQSVRVTVNGEPAGRLLLGKGKRDLHQLLGLSGHLRAGENVVELDGPKNADIAFQLVALHHVPWAAAARSKGSDALSFQVGYAPSSVPVGKTVQCQVEVSSSRESPVSMPLLEIGVPPGFEVESGDLDALRDKREIERYSVGSDRVTVYLSSLVKGPAKRFGFRLRAALRVRALAPASKAYAYYEPELRAETRPLQLTAR